VDARAASALQPVAQHGTVGLVHDVASHFDDEVRPDAQEVPVEGRVVQLAERETVRDDRLPLRMPVRQDVSCVEQLLGAVGRQTAQQSRYALRARKRKPS